jgi:hypothetical protein
VTSGADPMLAQKGKSPAEGHSLAKITAKARAACIDTRLRFLDTVWGAQVIKTSL